MKFHHIAIAVVFFVLLSGGAGWLLSNQFRTPCPSVTTGPTKEELYREALRDSLDAAQATRKHVIDSLTNITPTERHERLLPIVRSMRRATQRDSMLADPS